MKSPKVIAIVPVYNEERNLHRSLNPLVDMMKTGKIDNIIAINDGSTDNSQDKLEGYLQDPGFINIVLPENRGKAYAFYKAAKVCYQIGADIILTLDADLLDISEEQIDLLINSIIENPKINMTIGTVRRDSTNYSGQRAIRTEALIPLLCEEQEDSNWLYLIAGIKRDKNKNPEIIERIGYGLELTLNFLIGRTVNIYHTQHPSGVYFVSIVKTNFNAAPISHNERILHYPDKCVEQIVKEPQLASERCIAYSRNDF